MFSATKYFVVNKQEIIAAVENVDMRGVENGYQRLSHIIDINPPFLYHPLAFLCFGKLYLVFSE